MPFFRFRVPILPACAEEVRRLLILPGVFVLFAALSLPGLAQLHIDTSFRPPPPPPPPPTGTISVSATATPETTYPGGTDALSVSVTVSNAPSTVGDGGITGVCASPEYGDVTLSFPVTSGNYPNYHASASEDIEAPSEAGTVTFTCTVTVHYNNGTSGTGSGSTSFEVISCQGTINPIPAPSKQDTGQAANVSTWSNLTGTIHPTGAVSQPVSASGFGITGQLDNSLLPANLLDCDADPNDNIAEQDASIQGTADPPVNSQVVFSWSVTNYYYSSDNPCDSCDTNPEGHYPVVSTMSFDANAVSSSEYCQSSP